MSTFVENQVMGGELWKITEGDGFDIIGKFLSRYPHENYSLSFYNVLTSATTEIDCSFEEMEKIICFVCNTEHSLVHFIGANPMSESYVVGIDFTRGRIENAPYKAENGKLVRI